MQRSLSPRCTALKTMLLLVAAFIFAMIAPAGAQQPGGTCVSITQADLAGLEAQLGKLEVEITAARRRFDELATAAAPERQRAKSDLLALEAAIADLVFSIECLRTDWETVRGSGEAVEVTAYYATNRKPTGQAEPTEFYGGERAEALTFGRVTVSVPATHTIGEVELPSLWKLERTADPSRHFVFKSVVPMPTRAALTSLAADIGNSPAKAVLLFVHGFRSSFTDAALRTAQLAIDLDFPGVPMFFSWPASRYYSQDEETAELAKASLNELLDELSRLPSTEVYILAHSLGTRLVTRVLSERKSGGAPVGQIRELLLAAPDINAEIFKTEIAPAFAKMRDTRKTIYASSNDVALKLSRSVHGYPRLGDTSGGVVVVPGFEVVDSSGASPMRRAWGHSYVFDSRIVLGDLSDVILNRRGAAERGLRRAGNSPLHYWILE